MIKVLIRNNFTERETIKSKDTKFSDLLNEFNINPNIAPPALQGIVIASEDYDSTLQEIVGRYGLNGDAVMLTTVIKSNNA